MAEIVPVVSEALEAQIRDLLPSQRGFGEDLQASNVITPIIDLTAAAQGTTTPISMQQAIAFGSQTVFNVSNTTSTLINTTGFFRIFGNVFRPQTTATAINIRMTMTDGISAKVILDLSTIAIGYNQMDTLSYDFIVFLASGESLTATTNNAAASWTGSTRQIADVNGNLVNPSGYNPQ